MANTAKIEVIDSQTLKVTLPKGISVAPGKPVPPELLEMVALQLKLTDDGAGSEADCVVQFN